MICSPHGMRNIASNCRMYDQNYCQIPNQTEKTDRKAQERAVQIVG